MQGEWIREPKKDTVVIFVHGFLSSGDHCWRNKNGAYWPQLLESEPNFDTLGIYVYTYETGFFSGTYSLSDVVDDLKERMFNIDNLANYQKIIFVCHSMGGIIVRKLLVERTSDLINKKNMIGLFLIASPSLGSSYANWLSPIAKFLGHSQADVLRFTENNAWLNDLDKTFRNLKESENLKILGKELIEDKFIILPRFIFFTHVVERISGVRYFGEHYKVPKSDHFSIAKPKDQKADQHRLLLVFIENTAKKGKIKTLETQAVELGNSKLADTTQINDGARTIKLGLLGIGQSTVPQFSAIKNTQKFTFCHFSDKDPRARDELNKRGFGKVSFNTNYKEMLLDDDIDVVIVATELYNHYEHAKDVLNAKKNLLLEKPATLNLNQLKKLNKLAKKNKLSFVCSLHAAFDRTIEWILDANNIHLLCGEYGWCNDIVEIKCEFYDSYSFDDSVIQKDRIISLHDSWLDSGINALSVVSRFVDPKRISYNQSRFKMCSDPIYKDRIVDAEVEYSFDTNGRILINTSWLKAINKKVTTLTSINNVKVVLDHTEQRVSIVNNGSNYILVEFDQNRLVNQYINLFDDYYTHLINGTNNIVLAQKLHELMFKPIGK